VSPADPVRALPHDVFTSCADALLGSIGVLCLVLLAVLGAGFVVQQVAAFVGGGDS
jgi:hypothetical protein